jgi:outer membrane immunogenic protein
MKKWACAVAVVGLIGASAFAADMPVKAPAAAMPAPVSNWTGWYVGVNAGASFGSANTTFNVSPVTCGFDCSYNLGHSFSDKTYPTGFIGGGQIGYNWQYSPLIVVGLEADIQGASERDSSNITNSLTDFSSGGCCAVSGVTNYTTQIDWFGTVRGRVGYVWGDGAVLTYVTGGLAYGEVKINGTNQIGVSCLFPSCNPSATGSFSQPFSQSHVNTGWTIGTGTEGKLLIPGWTYKIETLYMDLGHLNATGVFSGCPGNLCTVGVPNASQITTNTHFTDWILRAGVNYQFH